MSGEYVSAGGFDLSRQDPHRLKVSATAARRRRSVTIFAQSNGSVNPTVVTVQADFTLETQVYRLDGQAFHYETPDGLLVIENAEPLTGSLSQESPLNPAIDMSVIEETSDFLMHTIHQDMTPLSGTGKP